MGTAQWAGPLLASFAVAVSTASGQQRSPVDTLSMVNKLADSVQAGELLGGPSIELTGAAGQPIPGVLVRVSLISGNGYLSGDTCTTTTSGIARFASLVIWGKPGQKQLLFSAEAAAPLTAPIKVILGGPVKLRVVKQPSPTITSDSTLKVQPVVRVFDNADNIVSGAEVEAQLCLDVTVTLAKYRVNKEADSVRRAPFKADSIATRKRNPESVIKSPPADSEPKCVDAGRYGAALLGTTLEKGNDAGQATFTDLVVRGPAGGYRLYFSIVEGSAHGVGSDTSNVMLYDPDRSTNRSYVVISAIKSVAGLVPADEFFDLRFRFRFTDAFFSMASVDIALTGRGTDTVKSNQTLLTEAAASVDWGFYTRRTQITDESERTLFVGAQLRVFNTLPYFGGHLGFIEHAGSVFSGSMFSLGIVHRMSDTLNVVQGDTLTAAPWNLMGDFFIRSSKIDFFKVLNLRGGILLPLRQFNQKLQSRITVAIPIGTIDLF